VLRYGTTPAATDDGERRRWRGAWTTTVLVVEDSRDTLNAYALLLRMDGFHVLKASTGREALHLCRHHYIGTLITGLNLPDIPGTSSFARFAPKPNGP
jgi:DNA-binding response OmpR family regulator